MLIMEAFYEDGYHVLVVGFWRKQRVLSGKTVSQKGNKINTRE